MKLLPLNQVPAEMLQVSEQETAEVIAAAAAAGAIPSPSAESVPYSYGAHSPSPSTETASVDMDTESRPGRRLLSKPEIRSMIA